MKLPPYPEYKDSGISWLGKIPAHWNKYNLRQILQQVSERNEPDLPLLSIVREKGVILRNISSKKENHNYIPDDLSNYKVVRRKQFAMNKMKAWQGSYGISELDGIVSPAYFVFGVDKVEAYFFHTAIRSKKYVPFFTQASDGVRVGQWDLNVDRMKDIPFFIPTESEQEQILKFIKWHSSQINKFIRNKRRLIDLLKEQKQNIINKAVTRGINPNVRLKPSGVDWIGDIPKHWEVIRLKNCITKMEQGWSPQCESTQAAYNQFGVLKVGCVNGDTLNVSQNKKLPESLYGTPGLQCLSIHAGDILVSRANTKLLVGLAAFSPKDYDKVLLCDKLFRFRAKDNAIPRYITHSIRLASSRAQVESQTNGASSSMQNIGQGVIKNLWIMLPSVEEQEEICIYIDGATASIDTAIAKAERQIQLMTEYRDRLIADVVTGKVDVRGVTVPEVMEEEQPDLMDAEDLSDIEFEDTLEENEA